jgi:hypothetical protein
VDDRFMQDLQVLNKYVAKINDISKVSKLMGSVYLRDFIEAQDLAYNLLSRAIQEEIKAKAELERVEAIAYLEEAPEYLKARNIKETADARGRYVSLSENVIQATDAYARAQAMVVMLKGKAHVLRNAHDTLKKILYGENLTGSYDGI